MEHINVRIETLYLTFVGPQMKPSKTNFKSVLCFWSDPFRSSVSLMAAYIEVYHNISSY